MPHRYVLLSLLVCASAAVLLAAYTARPSLEEGVPSAAVQPSSSVRVMSFNIRYNNPGDGIHAWPNRKGRVASVIRFHQADIVGVQEALIGQLRDLNERLPDHVWLGVGRDDGKEAGEFSPIFYRSDRFEVVNYGTFWLSETPEVSGSKSWDAALPRIVTWGQFRDKQGEASFFVFNTHFDHRGVQARRESARLLTTKVDAIAGEAPVIVTGDFNFVEESEAYRVLTQPLTDARWISEVEPHGPKGTFSGFEVSDQLDRRIDYIFVNDSVEVLRYGTLTDQWRGHYPSDHLPVLAEVSLP